MKVVFCVPTVTAPHPELLKAMEATVPLLDAFGIEHAMTFEVGCPYISHARSKLARKAMDARADVVMFLDHDVTWVPEQLVEMLRVTEKDDVVAGTYRYKKDDEEYMGTIYTDARGVPRVRDADTYPMIAPEWMPAGFLKITADGIDKFARAFPELEYGRRHHLHVDLFNHGAHKGIWYGEDYAFSRNYAERVGPIWLVPNLDLTHWTFASGDTPARAYAGNYHKFLCRQPGGSDSDNPNPPKATP